MSNSLMAVDVSIALIIACKPERARIVSASAPRRPVSRRREGVVADGATFSVRDVTVAVAVRRDDFVSVFAVDMV